MTKKKRNRKLRPPRHGRRSTASAQDSYAWACSLLRYSHVNSYDRDTHFSCEERDVTAESKLLPLWALGAAWALEYAADDRMGRYQATGRIAYIGKYRSKTYHYVIKPKTRVTYAPIPELEALRKRAKERV